MGSSISAPCARLPVRPAVRPAARYSLPFVSAHSFAADDSEEAEIAAEFGNQCVVVAVDSRGSGATPSGWEVTTHGGRTETDIDAIEWIIRCQELGAGELLVNSIDADGTRSGFDIEMLEIVRSNSHVPVIASGGAGKASDFVGAAAAGADAILAASIFHEGSVTIADAKRELNRAGFEVRNAVR